VIEVSESATAVKEKAETKGPVSGEKGQDVIQCVCGTYIRSPSDYQLIFLKKDQMEIDVVCPNPDCYLHELGFIKFKMSQGKPHLVDARFYSPFCTWNASRLGRDKMQSMLREHLIWLVEEGVDWKGVVDSLEKYEREKAEAEKARQKASETKAQEVKSSGS